MLKKSQVFLLDACPVIKLYELDLWNEVVERAEIVLPSIVADRETKYAPVSDGAIRLDLRAEAANGRICVMEADIAEIEKTRLMFDASLRDNVDIGEREALTLLRLWGDEPPYFCTSDHLATIALCLLGFADAAISLEALLTEIGIGRRIEPWWFTDAAMKAWLKEGRQRRITGEGLV